MKNLAVFVSGGGSNFQAIIDGINSGRINAKILACISSSPTAYALDRAYQNNIDSFVFERKNYDNIEHMFASISKTLDPMQIDYIILAGYMTVLPASFVSKYSGKIINIHPSLIPKYAGAGYYGMRVHDAVIQAGEKESGATVHFVDEGVDTGQIISQKRVPVYPYDTKETLAQRVLEAEHQLIASVVRDLCK